MTAPDAPLPAPAQQDRSAVVSWLLVHGPEDYIQSDEDVDELCELYAEARRAGFRAGIESAEKECEERAALNDAVEGETTGRFPASYHRAIEARECAAAIRSLAPDSEGKP